MNPSESVIIGEFKKIWREYYRVAVHATIAFLLTLSITFERVAHTWSAIAEEVASVSEIRALRFRAIEEWFILALATFIATAICATGFEYASHNKKRWISIVFLFTSPVLLFFTGAVAYIPYKEMLQSGWLVNLGIIPSVPFIAGIVSLIIGHLWRRCLRNRSRIVEPMDF